MTGNRPVMEPPAAWVATLERSAIEIAAGQTVPLAEVRAELLESIDRMRAKSEAAMVNGRKQA